MSIFGPNYAVFALGRFLIGFGQVGYYLPGFALGECVFLTDSFNYPQN